jgi:RimJ/RimL family protein N-acetyltransferase
MSKIEVIDFPKSYLIYLVKWRSDDHINSFLRQGMRTLSEIQNWYDQYFSLSENKLFCIKINDSPVGYFSLEHIDIKNRNCEFGIVIGEANLHGKGIGTSVLNLMLERAFLQMGMHRVYAYIQEGNSASEKCFSKSGFVLEGKLRESRFIGNEFRDIFLYSILESEWNV